MKKHQIKFYDRIQDLIKRRKDKRVEEMEEEHKRVLSELKKYSKLYADKCQENAHHIGILQERCWHMAEDSK